MKKIIIVDGVAYYKNPVTQKLESLGLIQVNDRNETTSIIDPTDGGEILPIICLNEDGKKNIYAL